MSSPSKLVRDAMTARLTAAWVTKFSSIVGDYTGVSAAEAQRLADIDWTGRRAQFFQGQLGVESLEKTSTVKYPLVILFAESNAHDGAEKFQLYSGSVTMALEFHYSWAKSSALPNFDEFMDMIEETVVRVFHDRAWVGAMGAGLSYRGEISSTRGPVSEGAENWFQSVSFRMVFGVDV